MTAFPFRPDKKLTDVLRERPFTLSAEIIPPRNGADQVKVLNQIHALVGAGAEFLAVTKGAGGSLRGGSLPIAQAVKENFQRPCIAHFTCRDLTAHEVENQLIDHHYFGIRNILALRGDPPDGQAGGWQSREGGHNYAHELIAQIRDLNQGVYLPRPGGPAGGAERTDFCIGAAVYPEHPNLEERRRFFQLKVDAGAQYAITDMLFDADAYGRFMDLCGAAAIRVPVIPGTRLLKTRGQAERMSQKFRVSVPESTLSALGTEDGPDAVARGLEIFLKFVDRLKQLGAPGVHLFVISDTAGAQAALARLASPPKHGRPDLTA